MKKKQLNVALTGELREFLEAESSVAGRSLAEEVRERLAATLIEDRRDAITRQFAAEVMRLAEEIQLDYGMEWHTDLNAHAAFGAAIADQLQTHKPKTISGAVPALLGRGDHSDPPEVIGRALARRYRRQRSELEKDRVTMRARVRLSKGERDE